MKKKIAKLMVSQKAVIIRKNKCLIVRLADERKLWDLPGGRVDVGEAGKDPFKRELKEETGIENFSFLAVVDYDIWISKYKNHVCGIVNLLENDNDEIVLSFEHDDLKWISRGQVREYKYAWPDMHRMIEKSFDLYKLIKKL